MVTLYCEDDSDWEDDSDDYEYPQKNDSSQNDSILGSFSPTNGSAETSQPIHSIQTQEEITDTSQTLREERRVFETPTSLKPQYSHLPTRMRAQKLWSLKSNDEISYFIKNSQHSIVLISTEPSTVHSSKDVHNLLLSRQHLQFSVFWLDGCISKPCRTPLERI